MNENWDETYDVVVVGGGTGLIAALTAAEAGLRAIVVEKTDHLGGSTSLSGGGMWIPGNAVLREQGVADTRARAGEYLDNLVADTAPRARRVSFLDHGPAAVDVLRRCTPLRFTHMREYADYFTEVDGGSAFGRAIEPAPFDVASLGEREDLVRGGALAAPVPMPVTSQDYKWMNLMTRVPQKAVPRVAGRVAQGIGGKALLRRNYAAGGKALAAGMIAGAINAGVPLWVRSPLQELVVDGGRVVGVVVEHEGRAVRIAATRGVILSAGGFDHNLAMRRRYQSPVLEEGWSFGSPGNTGDVIELAERAGARLTLMDQTWWFPAIPPAEPGGAPGALLAERSLPGSMIVDGTGHRFFNESVDYMTAGQIMLGLDDGEAPHLPAWLVFDQQYRNSYVFGGGLMPGQPLPKGWYRSGLAHKARSIEELAGQLGIPGLVDGARRFNLLAAQGHDDDFHRGLSYYDRYYGDPTNTPNPNLRPLTKGPFYAVQVVPGDLGTCGGLLADEYARVLHEDGSVIEGLYATGNTAGNAFGRYYPGPGATIGQGITFGYIAAMHAAGRLGAATPDLQLASR
ncbi:FAD-dependent oxidoreductase [Georgenia sp. TF02-10]|uniref:FAD-dependent oxidoreductase n=1 Tax=Georgenia sp. TF02-10 TaxID=2917725 RepID=UPI001FA7E8B5|nr:FAD-dependent oxidoreductase [Georgenia sp. TF02-10]UNX53793.1 FAD-dependent oxidoreductase [Georgenia sp. TF02-10]